MPTPPLSVSQASLKLNIPKRTVQHAIAKGHLKAHKLPGRTGAYLIYPAELTRWAGSRKPPADATSTPREGAPCMRVGGL